MRFCAIEKCNLPVFSTDRITRKGYCKSHANTYRTDLDRRTIINRAIDKQKAINNKVRSLGSEEANMESLVAYMNKGELLEWFKYHTENSPRICENCKKFLTHYSVLDWRNSQHHIIPKSHESGCPSVAAELNNHMVLCRWECHTLWHSSYKVAAKMPCFPLAKARFETFKHLIVVDEIKKIPDCFLL